MEMLKKWRELKDEKATLLSIVDKIEESLEDCRFLTKSQIMKIIEENEELADLYYENDEDLNYLINELDFFDIIRRKMINDKIEELADELDIETEIVLDFFEANDLTA